ncbi:MAG: glycoside hydrolase family 38 C-terminal domain-containing protein [Planctomycetota bacterium]
MKATRPSPPERTIHLVCNAHIDPAWLWEWQEGAGETLATFRAAAELCEEFDGFVFNHNEALLYEWIEQFEPALFRKIRRLVRARKWHIMGGWYLQPDCNMPSGESFVRQILLGQRYFKAKFGVKVATGINFDPFGHTRGLVQVLARSGYDSYLVCRPSLEDCPLPSPQFVWVGYDGSEILATLATGKDLYLSPPGGARRKVEKWIADHPDQECSVVLWGVGDHGGGPSRQDLRDLEALMKEVQRKGAGKGHHRGGSRLTIRHSTPEDYFVQLREKYAHLPRHERDLNPWAVGCYTTMVRVKQKHRLLENELYSAEKMVTAAAVQGLIPYPRAELDEAMHDLAACEFHDALPGSSIAPVEDATLRRLDHGLEILSRVKARTFFALAAHESPSRESEIPILVYNHHPFPVETIVECELQPLWSHGTDQFERPTVARAGTDVPTQTEKPLCNIDDGHRKRVVFPALLEPGCVNRFDCRLELVPRKPAIELKAQDGAIRFQNDELEVVINSQTGLIDRYRVHGVDYLQRNACRALVIADNADPWGMTVKSFRQVVGRFRLLSERASTLQSGVAAGTLPAVRVIEDGPVRSVVEAVFGYQRSFLCHRIKLPKRGTEVEIEIEVLWNEIDKMLKLSLPTPLHKVSYLGQVAYGVADLPADGSEAVAQKWVAVVAREKDLCLTCINEGIHGSDFSRGELRLSLLRSPAHAGHPTGPGRPIARQDRYVPRIDRGERSFRFWLNAGTCGERLEWIDREALTKNEKPFALAYSPPGSGKKPRPGVVLSDDAVMISAFKYAEDSDDLIIRLFEPTGTRRTLTLDLPCAGAQTTVELAGFEVRTLRFNRRVRKFTEVDLVEEPLRGTRART